MKKLLAPFQNIRLSLKNHLVMAPMTRSRAVDNVPNALMAEYYHQRSGAALIITEGTAPAPEALGYPSIPGIFDEAQVEGWKLVTKKVHEGGSKIFVQLMHTGRIGHEDNLPADARLVGPSNLRAAGQIFTPKGMQDHTQPIALTTESIQEVIQSYVTAAENAIKAGFDGVELHAANGYLPEQFLNPNVNTRTDGYGGSVENRSRFIIEVAEHVAGAIGSGKVGIRFSPFSGLGDLAPYAEEEVHATYAHLSESLNNLQLLYLHIGVNAPIPAKTFDVIRENFKGILILCNGLTPESGEEALGAGFADLVAFGRSFLANPDLVERIEKGQPFNQPDYNTFYTPGSKGYTDYPTFNNTKLSTTNNETSSI